MLKLNIPNLEAIRNWCNEKFQPKGNYITKSEIGNEVNETEITLSDLSETVPEAISAMSEEKKLKNLLSHIKAFMTGSKALIDLCVTTGMITQQNINDENKIPSAALLYSLNDALNGQVAQINSNLGSFDSDGVYRIGQRLYFDKSGILKIKIQVRKGAVAYLYISSQFYGDEYIDITFDGIGYSGATGGQTYDIYITKGDTLIVADVNDGFTSPGAIATFYPFNF